MEEISYLNDICRLCLAGRNMENFKIFFEITKEQQEKFENITQSSLPLNSEYPSNVCSNCSDNLEQFYFYKNQLIRKQNELKQCITTNSKESTNEEFIEDETIFGEDCDEEEIFVIDADVNPDEVSCEFEQYQLADEEDTTQDEPINNSTFEQVDAQVEAIESDNDFEVENLSQTEDNTATPRVEEIKYQKVTPTLILTPNYMKLRETLKKRPRQSRDLKTKDYMPVALIVNSEENIIYVCNHSKCKAEFESEQEMKCHQSDHYSDGSLRKCVHCPMVFKTNHFYQKHVETVHGGNRLMCQVCGKILDTRIQLRGHVRNHDSTLKYKCTFEGCDKAFRVKHHLDNHNRTHSKDSPFCCTFEGCKSKFRQSYALTIHLRKHTGDFKICSACKSPFATQFHLNKHLDKCDGTFKPLITRGSLYNRKDGPLSEDYKCCIADCLSSFKAKLSLEKHLTKAHQIDVTETTCVLCCQEFESQQEAKLHLREHLPYTCLVCNLNFRNEEILKSHMKNSHEKDEVRLHKCQQCSTAFKRAEHLRSHIAYKHNKARPYCCDSCTYKSPTRHDLNSHVKMHLKGKDFSCRLCKYVARKLSAVKAHMKTIHQTDEYYCCSNCNQGFKYQNDFHQHQKDCC